MTPLAEYERLLRRLHAEPDADDPVAEFVAPMLRCMDRMNGREQDAARLMTAKAYEVAINTTERKPQ